MWLLALLLALRLASGALPEPTEEAKADAATLWPIVADRPSGCLCAPKAPEGLIVVCFDLLTCVRFPRDVAVPPDPRGLATLHVGATLIGALLPGDLSRLGHLTELFVDNSRALSLVARGAFRGMARLANLSLSFNPRLTHLQEGSLDGLPALRRLRLAGNGIVSPADVAPALAALPALRALSLDENALRGLAASDFAAMAGSPLEELSLARCGLVAVHPRALAPLRRLAALHLAGNNANPAALALALAGSLDGLRDEGRTLDTLDLAGVGLTVGRGDEASANPDEATRLLQSIARSRVGALVLRCNEVARLGRGTLPAMPALRRLDLSHVDLEEGRAGALSAEAFPALEELDLSDNRLPGLQRGFVSPRLRSLTMNASAAFRFDLSGEPFAGMERLEVLHLAHDRILRLTNRSLQGLTGLRALSLRNASLFRLDAGAFLPLRRLELLDLQQNWFASVRLLSADVFLGLDRLRVLLLGSCNMSSLGGDPNVFRHLGSLTHLDLQDNALATLDGSRAFGPLRALQSLDVSRNGIASWGGARLFARNEALREVRARGNTLTHLSAAMLDDLEGLRAVDLADNAFHCGCDLYRPLRQRLDRGQGNATRALISRYSCLSPDRWRGRPIAEYVEWRSGQPSGCQAATALLAAAPTLGAVLLLLLMLLACGAALAFRFRHHIRYHFDVAAKKRAAADATVAYANYLYDAFVSYSSEDQEFVRVLVTALEDEEPHFRLCVYERDFEAGVAITEAVLSSVAQSRRVLLVVSAAFARSHWCAWEAHVAHHQRLLAEDALLVVRLGRLDDSLLSPTLRYLLRTRVYLEYARKQDDDGDGADSADSAERQRAFWRKLRAALGIPVRARGPEAPPPTHSGRSGEAV